MSYSITMLARRITALEALPSAQRPLRITGGLPRDYVPPKASPAAQHPSHLTRCIPEMMTRNISIKPKNQVS
jgi:hypothetical protein